MKFLFYFFYYSALNAAAKNNLTEMAKLLLSIPNINVNSESILTHFIF